MKKEAGVILLAGALATGAMLGENRKHIKAETDYPQPNALSGVLMISTSTTTATTLAPLFESGSDGVVRWPR